MNPKLSLATGILFIAFSPIFVKLAGAAPVTSAFYRILIAWLLIAPYCLLKGKLKIERRQLWITILAGVVFGVDIAVWNISILKIGATISTLLANLVPVWVGLISFIFLRKKSGLTFWLGTVIAIAGTVLLVGFNNVITLKFSTGILLALLSSFLYALYILLTKNVLQSINTATFMFYNMLGAFVLLFFVELGRGANLTTFAPATWLYFLAMGALCQLIGWLVINYAIGKLPATTASVALLSQSVVTAAIAALLLGERLTPIEITGCAIVLTGIAVTFIKGRLAAS